MQQNVVCSNYDNVGKFRDEKPFLLLIDAERVTYILMKELQELPKIPRELIERFTKETEILTAVVIIIIIMIGR